MKTRSRQLALPIRPWSIFLFAIVLLLPAVSSGQSHQQQFVTGLRQRRLLDLAKWACEKELRNPALDPTQRAELAIELLKTESAIATQSAAEKKEAAWQNTFKTGDAIAAQFADSPRGILVKIQAALMPLEQATMIRRQMDFQKIDEPQKQNALALLRKSISDLTKCLNETRLLKAQRTQQKPRSLHPLTAEQLNALEKNIQLKITVCDQTRAEFYPATDRVNRIDLLTRVDEQLDAISRQVTKDDPLWLEVRLIQIQSSLMLNKYAQAKDQIQSLLTLRLSDFDRQRVENEKIKLALATKQPQSIANQLNNEDFQCHLFQPLDIALVQLALMMAEKAADKNQKQAWQNQAVRFAADIEATHGPYWGRLADIMMVDVAKTSGLPSNIQMLVRLSDEYLRKKQFADAIDTLDSAADLAIQQESPIAFSIAYRAAILLQQQKQFDEASQRLRILAQRFPDHESAAAAHMLACWNKAQQVQKDAEKIVEYKQLLKENINQWPESKSSPRVRTWYAKMLQYQKEYRAAFEVYRGVTGTQFDKNTRSMIECAMLAIEQAKTKNPKIVETILESLSAKSESTADPTSTSQQQIQLARAQIMIQHQRDYQTAEQKLLSPLLRMENLDEEIRLPAKIWLVVAVSGQLNREQDAQKLFQSLSFRGKDSATWLAGLAAVDSDFKSKEAAAIKVQIATKLLASDVPEKDRPTWQLILGKSYVAIGKTGDAIQTLDQLAQSNKSNFKYELELARALSRDSQSTNQERALSSWRKITRKLKPNTETWFEAKYNVALMQTKLGAQADADKLVRYLQATVPNWQKNPWRAKFEALGKTKSQY